MEKNYIFKLDREDYNYRGILFADLDLKKISLDCPVNFFSSNYETGFMGIIWTDEKGMWHFKGRVKFPSGNKMSTENSYEDEHKEELSLSVQYVLEDMKRLPLINEVWYPNPTGSIDGMIEIMKNSDMIEWMKVEKINDA